jgi:hypothetical protein
LQALVQPILPQNSYAQEVSQLYKLNSLKSIFRHNIIIGENKPPSMNSMEKDHEEGMQNFHGLQSPLKRDADWHHNMEPASTPNRLPEPEMPFTQLADPPTKMPRLAPITIAHEDHSPLKVSIYTKLSKTYLYMFSLRIK